MRHLLLALASCFLIGCCAGVGLRAAAADPIAHAHRSTVALVEIDDTLQPSISCTGVWISHRHVLTAAHCVEEANLTLDEQAAIMLGGDPPQPLGRSVLFVTHAEAARGLAKAKVESGWIIAYDRARDLALVSADDGEIEHDVASLGRGELRVGDELGITGHSAGLGWSWTPGWVGHVRPMQGVRGNVTMRVVQVWSGAWFGNSGGGAWRDGELVGLCSFAARGTALTFWIPADEIRGFLEREAGWAD